MNRRELLTGAAVLAGVGQAHAFGLGKLGARGGFGSGGALGGAGVPPPPIGFAYLIGADGAYLKGADGAYLLGAA